MATVGVSEAHPSRAPVPRSTKVTGAALALVLALVAGWALLHDRRHGSVPMHAASGSSVGRRVAGGSVGTRTLQDSRSGYEISYPASWSAVPDPPVPAGAEGHLFRIGGQDALSIQTFQLQRAVTTTDLRDMRAVTDAILSTPSAKLTVLDVRRVNLGGLPAIYYLYYFPSGNHRGIHAHYFVFDGRRMQTQVFQVVPATDFAEHAAEFDQVVASFKPLTH